MTTPLFDLAYQFFYGFLAGGEPSKATDFITKLYRYIIGTGFFEELTKAVPLFVIYGITQFLKPQHRDEYGIQEPLDGILIGAASAAGFAMVETVGLYISSAIEEGWVHGAVVLINKHLLSANVTEAAAKGLMAQVMGQRVEMATQLIKDVTVDLQSLDLDFDTPGLPALNAAVRAVGKTVSPLITLHKNQKLP